MQERTESLILGIACGLLLGVMGFFVFEIRATYVPWPVTRETIQSPYLEIYDMRMTYLDASAELLNLARARRVLDHRDVIDTVRQYKDAREEKDLVNVGKKLSRALYFEAVDYGEILHRYGLINEREREEVRQFISCGKTFTQADLADQISYERDLELWRSTTEQYVSDRMIETRKRQHKRRWECLNMHDA